MSEELNEELVPDAEPDADVDADASALAVDMGGNKMVPLSALIAAKREAKTTKGRIKELEKVAERAADIDAKLASAQPYIDAIVTNPNLKAAALRAVNGTRTSADTTAQPESAEDPEAAEFAEIQGMYLPDGQPDIARAQRALRLFDARHGRQTDERMRPLAGITLNNKANENLRAAAAQTDDDGVPLATMESIREVAGTLPPHLLADPNVVDVVLNSAIGIDRRKHRTPKAPDEPLYLASAGAGRGRAGESMLDADMKGFLARQGISEKDGAATIRNLEVGVQTRKGVTFGSK